MAESVCAVPGCGERVTYAGHCKPHGAAKWFREHIIEAPGGCWIWLGSISRKGYGLFGDYGLAHRWSYERFVGPIADGLEIDHLCRNRRCVNPRHLDPVTHRENVVRGSGFAAVRSRLTHCKRGHEFTAENTIWTSDSCRRCRTCTNERLRNARRKAVTS